MHFLIYLCPVLLFILVFVGSGIYFSAHHIDNAFYQISPICAIFPSLFLAWILRRDQTSSKMHDFLDGMRHRDIITMCIIFLLAGSFSEITKYIGAIDAAVHLTLSLIPSHFLLIGVFFVSAFVSTSIGTSMGTIATISPIALSLATKAHLDVPLTMATVVGGSMFGDNLSIVSDTTIAAVMSQEANMKEKLKLNVKVALISSLITLFFLSSYKVSTVLFKPQPYTLYLIFPYIFLIILSSIGVNVFVSLVLSIISAIALGFYHIPDCTFLKINACITTGFSSMQEIMILSLFVGGLSGLIGKNFVKTLTQKISDWIVHKKAGQKIIQLIIAKIVSVFDILFANNTIAIIFSGEIARELAKKHHLPRHYSATWLDIFSCVFQGILPYGAQILLVSAHAKISPLSIVPYVYYCYILGIVSISYILLHTIKKNEPIKRSL